MSDINTPKYTNGNISFLANWLYEEYITMGYSLLYSDIEVAILNEVKDYIPWNGELKSLNDKETDSLLPLDIDGETVLTVEEWAIIKPVVQAYCDIIQAKRLEGTQNLGVQPVGMTASEAKQAYREVRLQMQKEAFDCEPHSVDFSTLDNQSNNGSHSKIDVSLNINNRFWCW